MADLFLSYGRADLEIAKALAEQLLAEGRTVWWDAEATPGANFRDEIARQLDDAKSVIVLWTPNSVRSEWVISEAQRALNQKKLIPVRTPDTAMHDVPQPFDTLQTPILDEKFLAAINRRARRKRGISQKRFFGFAPTSLRAKHALFVVLMLTLLLPLFSGRSVLMRQDVVQPGETYHLKGYGNLGDSKQATLACYYFTGFSIVGVSFWYSPNDYLGRHRCPAIHGP